MQVVAVEVYLEAGHRDPAVLAEGVLEQTLQQQQELPELLILAVAAVAGVDLRQQLLVVAATAVPAL